MKKTTLFFLLISLSVFNLKSEKQIHIPTWMLGDVTDDNNSWSYSRSKQSNNWILFWEKGYGEDPSTHADENYRVAIDNILEMAEKSFDFYADSLKFIKRGSSKTDTYKMIIRLRYTTDWEATGSGVDDTIGLLTLTAWSGRVAGHTLAHEVGHCFQYQVHCDNNNKNGWMYGFGANASGHNGWWEQCAQWQAFKIYPEQQFTDGRFAGYLKTAHKHILHEAPRYDNYFIQDYWSYLHGMDFIGRLWNESESPEDPIEAYKRITNITQEQFNDEIYDCASRFVNWDIPAFHEYGKAKIGSHVHPTMTDVGDGYLLINPSFCLENYGYNVIKLKALKDTTVSVVFEGKAGIDGYRKKSVSSAGWRYGFVAQLSDGTPYYSEMNSAVYQSPKDTVYFQCPSDCQRLWFVVTGAPTEHWRHPWDENDSNDEQWPYQVQFGVTNYLGKAPSSLKTIVAEQNIAVYTSDNTLYAEQLPLHAIIAVYDISGRCVLKRNVEANTFSTTLPSGIYIINIHSEGHNYNQKVIIR